ncbi:hypothetical protein ACIQMJ_27420 [Actinosynnema sp. NPDC091369]
MRPPTRDRRETARRAAASRIAQQVGMSWSELRECSESLPDHRTPARRARPCPASRW